MRLVVILLAFALAALATAAAPPTGRLIAFGAIAGDDVYAADLIDLEHLRFSVRGLSERRDRYGFWGGASQVMPPRWSILGDVMFANGTGSLHGSEGGFDGSPALEGYFAQTLGRLSDSRGVEQPPLGIGLGFVLTRGKTLADYPREVMIHSRRDIYLHYDYVPRPGGRLTMFLYTNAPEVAWIRKGDTAFRESYDAPVPKFSVHEMRGAFNADRTKFAAGAWREVGTCEIAFKEHFHAFVRGDDWFFLTESGKLFHARRPAAKAGPAKVTKIHDNPKRPVEAFVQHVEGKRHFLFCRNLNPGGKPSFFELSDRPRHTEYDPADRPAPSGRSIDRIHAHAVLLKKRGLLRPADPDPEPEPKP